MQIPYIDAQALEQDVAQFAPVISMALSLVPGAQGNALRALVTAFEANPSLLSPVVALINEASGAKPPALVTAMTKPPA